MKHTVAFLTLALLTLGQLAVQADPFLIVPGRSIGQTHLGRNGDYYLKNLPPPTASDAGMSQEHLVWLSRTTHATLYIHTVSNGVLDPSGKGVSIDEIRVSSPQFHTRDGLHTGSTFAQVRRRFPQARAANGEKTIYAVARQGIAFEFARRPSLLTHCIAVTVFPPGQARTTSAAQVRDLLRDGERP